MNEKTPAPEGAPAAWKWRNKVTGAHGCYFEDPAKFMSLDHPDYEWSKLYAHPAPAPAEGDDLCERICAAIHAADDKSMAEAGYMLDCHDCCRIVRDQFAAANSQLKGLTDPGAYDRGVIAGLRQAAAICADREDMTADKLKAEIEACIANSPMPTLAPEPELPPLPLAGEFIPGPNKRSILLFTADQMRAYARAAQANVQPKGSDKADETDLFSRLKRRREGLT